MKTTVKEYKNLQPNRTKTKKKKKRSKMLRWTKSNYINNKGPRLSKFKKSLRSRPPLTLKPSLRDRIQFRVS